MNDRFRILIQERSESTCDPPEQPPDAGPDDLDMILWRFCYAENRRILLQVGSAELEAELDPDIRAIWIYLPRMVSRLSAGETEVLSFSERWYDVKLVPQGDTMLCVVERSGQDASSQTFSCDRAEVLAELRRFLAELADLATAAGYLTPAKRRELMGD